MRLARIQQHDQETFAVLNNQGKAITSKEIAKQTGLTIPLELEKALFGEYFQKIKDRINHVSFTHQINEFKLLPPIRKSFKVICLAFNYTDQSSWVRFGRNPPRDPVIYLKPRTSLIGPTDDIICPEFVKQLDYEGDFLNDNMTKNIDFLY